MSTVKNPVCKFIPQVPSSKSLLKKRPAKEKLTKEQKTSQKIIKEKPAKEKKGKEQKKKGKPEKAPKSLKSNSESDKKSLSFKDLNSHFGNVQFSTKPADQIHWSVDPIGDQPDQLTGRWPDPGNDLEERTGEHFHFIGVGFKSQLSRQEDDR